VERCNRKLRYWEKVRYKWRRRRTLVRFLVLALDAWWQRTLSTLEAAQAAAKANGEPAQRRNESKEYRSEFLEAPMAAKRRNAA
jgi:hypothetical protein